MAGTVGKGALLLKDAQGEKSGYLLNAFRKKNVAVLRGSLLIALSPKDTTSGADGKPAHNYSVYNEDITLYCSEYDIAPLTNYEFKLLSGISTSGARYDAFISDNHELGSNLRLGDTVYVALPTKEAFANTGCQAVVRWIGTLLGETGIKFGIEITEDKYRGSGSTNGCFQDRQLFICGENCGMFVSLERLAPTPNFRLTRTLNAQPTKAPLPYTVRSPLRLKTDSEGKSQNMPGGRANTSHAGPAASTHTQGHTNSGFRFYRGNRVITHNKDQVPIHGTVRWTGESNSNGGKVNVVGIETDIPVQRGDFLVTITGLSSNFRCENSKHGKLVVPEELVQTEMEEKQRRVEERQRKEEELARLHERMEVVRVVNLSGSCVDPPDSHHSESRLPAIYDNMPGGGNKQPDVIVIAPESQDSHQFVIGSRVEFSDPP